MNPTLHAPIGAAEFKARCLQIMDQVKETAADVTITKHVHPVAKLVPIKAQVSRFPLVGSCKCSLVILGEDDLVPSTEGEWHEWEAKVGQGPGGAYRALCCCWIPTPCFECCRTIHGPVPKLATRSPMDGRAGRWLSQP